MGPGKVTIISTIYAPGQEAGLLLCLFWRPYMVTGAWQYPTWEVVYMCCIMLLLPGACCCVGVAACTDRV